MKYKPLPALQRIKRTYYLDPMLTESGIHDVRDDDVFAL